MALGQLAGKELGAKTREEPPWGLPALTQKIRVSSGPHPLPACSQPCTLLTATYWLGFLAWPETCLMAEAGVVITGPLAVPGHHPDLTPLSSLGCSGSVPLLLRAQLFQPHCHPWLQLPLAQQLVPLVPPWVFPCKMELP